MNFMDLSEEYSSKDSRFCIIKCPKEGNVSYGKGAKKGADEIIKASKQLEYYDEQFDNEPYLEGIRTLKFGDGFEGFPIFLGGDHSVTIDSIKAMEKKDDFDVIIFDAHPDFFYSWNGSKDNHRCVGRDAALQHNVLEVGIRSMDKDEKELIDENENIEIIKAYEYDDRRLCEKLGKLKKKVYISIDVDVFDPSFIRNTGTPEPGGFLWDQVIDMLETIFSEKDVVGADLVEFAPEQNVRAEAYSLAKLCYKIFSLKSSQ